MLSRVAANLYWTTRYMERAEDTARLINAVTLMSLDMPGDVRFGWSSLIRVAGLDHVFFEHYAEANEVSVMRFLLHDEKNPSSILNCITQARENTRTFREVVPWEFWEGVNELYLYAKQSLGGDLTRRRRYDVLQAVIRRRQSMVGLLVGTMSRDAAFQFLRLGRNMERADMTSRILDVSCAVIPPRTDAPATPYSDLAWMSILKALSAYQMYRRYVSVHADGERVIEFLLKNRDFPRTVAHCLTQILSVLRQLPNPDPVMAVVEETLAFVERADSATLAKRGLHAYTDQIQLGLSSVHDALRRNYFKQGDGVNEAGAAA